MESLAILFVIFILLIIVRYNYIWILQAIFIVPVMSYIFTGFGFLFFAGCATDKTFAETPFLSGVIGWILFTILSAVSFLCLIAITNHQFKKEGYN